MNTPDAEFDFLAHRRNALDKYHNVYPFFQQFAATLKQLIEATPGHRRIKVQSVQARAKDPSSFGNKATQPSETDPRKPKYPLPLAQITDSIGVRIMEVLDELRVPAEAVVHHDVVVVAHRARKQHVDLAPQCGMDQAVEECIVGRGIRAEQELALRAPAGDQVELTWKHLAREHARVASKRPASATR
jgi:hypothetical protein